MPCCKCVLPIDTQRWSRVTAGNLHVDNKLTDELALFFNHIHQIDLGLRKVAVAFDQRVLVVQVVLSVDGDLLDVGQLGVGVARLDPLQRRLPGGRFWVSGRDRGRKTVRVPIGLEDVPAPVSFRHVHPEKRVPDRAPVSHSPRIRPPSRIQASIFGSATSRASTAFRRSIFLQLSRCSSAVIASATPAASRRSAL